MMKKEKVKVYIYTRVSTAMQIDGYSLDAQKSRMKAYAEFNDYEIVGEYEDAGKSGKSIEGRVEFNRMMEDIKSGKDDVSYVLVFKLSRFGRNAADVLSTLQVMQDFGVNLICVEDGIDSSKDAGKLMISVLSAVAEIERENIRVQTMEGRIQKAREGKWNGGFAPYGYKLEKGQLFINEEEAAAIRVIFDQYVHTDTGANGLAKYLATHGIHKIQRQNGKNPLFDSALIRRILKNPVYCGKIAYGRRRTEKVHGTRNDYRLVEQDDYLLVDGLHEGIVSEELWHEAQVKLLAQAEKYERVNRGKDTKIHLLSGIVKCPVCGVGMYGNKSIKHKADGSKYKDFYYYGCKHRAMTRGHKCDFKKQINEELLDSAVAEVIVKLVSNPKFAAMMQEKISMKVDTSSIEQEIAAHEKQLRQSYSVKVRLMDEIDSLDPDDKHYIKRKADLDDRLYKMYDKIEDTENQLVAARAKKMAIEAEKLTGDNIYKVLIYFDKLYSVMDDQEKRQLMESLISEIQIYEERQPNGQWLKSIKFKLPIIAEDMSLSLDNDTHIDTVVVYLKQEGSYDMLPCVEELWVGKKTLFNDGSSTWDGIGGNTVGSTYAYVIQLHGSLLEPEVKEYQDIRVVDLLPDGVHYEKVHLVQQDFSVGSILDGGKNYQPEVIENYHNSGRTAAIFHLNVENLRKTVRTQADIYFGVTIDKDAHPGTVRNDVYVVGDNLGEYRGKNSHTPDIYDLNNNGRTDDMIACGFSDATIIAAQSIYAEKFIAPAASDNWSKQGLLIRTGSDFDYLLKVTNETKAACTGLVVYDTLPRSGDENIFGTQSRNSEFDVHLRSAITPLAGYTVYYTTSAAVYEKPMADMVDADIWTDSVSDYSAVTAFKIVAKEGTVLNGESTFEVRIPAQAPSQLDDASMTILHRKAPQDQTTGTVTWLEAVNSFGFHTAESPSVKESNSVWVRIPFAGFCVKKVDDASGSALSGAEFTLTDATGNVIAAATSGEDGLVQFRELTAGTYTLTETKVPDGYMDSHLSVTVTITQNPVTMEYGISFGDLYTGAGSTADPLCIPNRTMFVLPGTGGAGTARYMTGGTLLMAAAYLLYIRNKRRKTSD